MLGWLEQGQQLPKVNITNVSPDSTVCDLKPARLSRNVQKQEM
jgi:hypothetical protein